MNSQTESILFIGNGEWSRKVSNILVDDKESTIISWNDSGGIGIFHEPGNSSRSVREIKLRLGL